MITRANLNPEKYHRLAFNREKLPDLASAGHVSASLLSRVRNPLLFMTQQEKESTPDMSWGSLVDMLWLTPNLFDNYYVVLPENAPQKPTAAMLSAKKPSPESVARQKWWADFESTQRGREAVPEPLYREAQRAISMLNQHPVARDLRQRSEPQVAMVGKSVHKDVTFQVKALMDMVCADAILDLKTTNDLSESGTDKAMVSYEYALKMTWYRRIMREAGQPKESTYLIWQRSSFPYDVKVRRFHPDDLDMMEEVIERRLDTLISIDPKNLSSLYDTEIRITPLPIWAQKSYMLELGRAD